MLVNNKPFFLKTLLKKEASRGVYLIIMLLDYLSIWVPRFCYHTKLSASGNCRMCLVEVKGSIKPLVACCTILNDNVVIYTNTELIRRSREYIMEFLLINHPLDCPICDQAGECDLQDLALIYGSDDSRFKYNKKAILNKNIDSLIKTTMNRCIYCTRCVRYTSELNNVYSFNTLGRGGFSEIGNYYSNNIVYNNYINGNVIDLCPVGALTAKPYSFRNRIWELVSVESIDILDSLCSNIRIDTRNNIVERVLPKPNDNINDEWITDKIRFCYDGFKKQRLSYPFYKFNIAGVNTFVLCSWYLLFHKIKVNYKINFNVLSNNNFFHIYTGHLIDVFSLSVLKTIITFMGITNLNLNLNLNIDLRKYFIFNNNIKTFELNNVFLIFGTNPRVDSPILNMKLRHIKYKYNKKINICYIGSKLLLNYSLVHIGLNNNSLLKLFYGKSFFCTIIKKIYNIICLFSVGFSLFFNDLLVLTLDTLSFFLKKQNFVYSYITLFAGDVSIYELGIISYYYKQSIFLKNNKPSMYYLLGVDFTNLNITNKAHIFNIYHGHHGNTGLYNSNVILPSNTYIENTCYFLNCEGRFVVSNVSISKKKKIINNESVIYNLFTFLHSSIHRSYTYYDRILLLFFYKCSFFFIKFKFFYTLHLSVCRQIQTLNLYFYNLLFTFSNAFFNMDVFSKSSYYILKIKEKELVSNFL